MPVPGWWGHITKRVFHPHALKSGKGAVLTHVGRSSGMLYRTPMEAHPVDGGYLVVLVRGSRSDWVRNVMAAGHAKLTVDGEDVEVSAPRVVSEAEAFAALAEGVERPPKSLRVKEFLRMDRT